MAFRNKNASKFRVAKLSEEKEIYRQLRPSDPPSESLQVAASHHLVAFTAGEGGRDVCILPMNAARFKMSATPPTIQAGGDRIVDVQFNPFNDFELVTLSSGGTVAAWTIPEDFVETGSGARSRTTISVGEDCGANCLRMHPSAAGVAAVCGKRGIYVVDLGAAKVIKSFEAPPSATSEVVCVDWNFMGNLLAAVDKNQQLHCFDPRSAPANVLTSPAQRLEDRPQRVLFLGPTRHLLVTATNRMRQPKLMVFREADIASGKPVLDTRMELSVGYLLPLYDIDTELLFLAVRGSGLIQMFDMSTVTTTPTPGPRAPPPSLTRVDQITSAKVLIQGCALVPKSACRIDDDEVQRVMRLTKDSLEPVNVTVPRRTRGYHEELFPATPSDQPGMTAEEWLRGKDAAPSLVNIVKLRDGKKTGRELEELRVREAAQRAKEEQKQREEEEQRHEEERKRMYVPSERRKVLEKKLAKSPFHNVKGVEPSERQKDQYCFDAKIDPCCYLNKNLRVNSRFWASPFQTVGGSALGVFPLSRFNRYNDVALIRGHPQQLSCFDISKLTPTLVASGTADAHVKLFSVPESGLTKDLTEAKHDFLCSGKVTCVEFHPLIDHVLVTSSVGFDGASVRLWDLHQGAERIHLQCHPEQVWDIAFKEDGVIMGTTSKDGKCRLIDPRAKHVVSEWSPVESKRDTHLIFMQMHMLTVGFGAASRRSISLWDMRNLDKHVKSLEIDQSNSTPMSCFDEDSSLLFLGSSGSRVVRVFEVSTDDIVPLGTHQAMADLLGMDFHHKLQCDVREVHVATGRYLTQSQCIPLHFKVPRKRTEFFQDDLFPPTRSDDALLDSTQWFEGKNGESRFIDLRPAGMTPLSQAPPEETTERERKYQERLAKKAEEEAPKPSPLGYNTSEEVLDHFRRIADSGNVGALNRWDNPAESGDEVDPDEWND